MAPNIKDYNSKSQCYNDYLGSLRKREIINCEQREEMQLLNSVDGLRPTDLQTCAHSIRDTEIQRQSSICFMLLTQPESGQMRPLG